MKMNKAVIKQKSVFKYLGLYLARKMELKNSLNLLFSINVWVACQAKPWQESSQHNN